MGSLWNLVSKRTFKIGGTVGLPGLFSVTAEMGLEADRVVDVLQTAKAGISICNIGVDVVLLNLAVDKLLNVKVQAMSKIREKVEELEIYAAMLGTTKLKAIGLHLEELPDVIVVLLSVLLSVSNVLGREAAVEVTTTFIAKLKEADKGELPLDKVRMKAILMSLLQDMSAGGTGWVSARALEYDARYDVSAREGEEGEEVSPSQVFKKVTFGMMGSLIWWLYSGMKVASDGEAEVEPQICKSYDSRMHKVVYLLEKFGWPVHAALRKIEQDFGGVPRVVFLAHECMEGVEDVPLLSPDEVGKHGLRVPRSGSWMLCNYKEIGKVLRAQIGSSGNLGRRLESGWEEGWKIGISRKVSPRFSDSHGMSHGTYVVLLGDPTLEARDHESFGCENLLLGGGGADIKGYAGRFHRMYGGTRKEYESLTLPFMSKFVADTQLKAALVGFGLGYLCGSIFAVARWMNLPVHEKAVCLSWLDDMYQFLYDLDGHMRKCNFGEGVNLGGCLDLITGCFYGEADRIGLTHKTLENNCIGTVAGDKVLLLEAIMNPSFRSIKSCRMVELDVLPINVPCRDGKYIFCANEHFNSSRIVGTELTSPRRENARAERPTYPLSVTIGPNLIDGDGTLMHSMYACGSLIHCASILYPSYATQRKCREPKAHRSPLISTTYDWNKIDDYKVRVVTVTDLIKGGVLVSPRIPATHGRVGTIRDGRLLVQVLGDDLWRYTIASMYRLEAMSIDGLAVSVGCLPCIGNDVEVIIA